ncbi:MAG: flagellar protein, partial [Bradyrhizobium sp.]|nr:flagellar protein [Bradyrhizobium sp.]
MTGIVLSASVRQNLLSLQSTASLLATTQNDLATGNKVNSALDNPTSYFTASALNNRASDISNLLDGIGNGVQVLQAANTGITSLQSLVASAQSVANQVLQTTIGYDSKSSVTTTAITGATPSNLLGAGTGYTSAAFTGAVVHNDNSTPANISGATQLVGTASSTSNDLGTAITNGSTLVVNNTTITFSTSAASGVSGSVAAGYTVGIGAGATTTVANVLSTIDSITGGSGSTVTAGSLVINT